MSVLKYRDIDLTVGDVLEFHKRYKRAQPTACWPWLGSRNRSGYGTFVASSGKRFVASRVAWRIARGVIEESKVICHHCDNPPCVNPGHLFMGTHKDNSVDAQKKGRLRRPGRPAKVFGVTREELLRVYHSEKRLSVAMLGFRYGLSADEARKIMYPDR